ncbi:unnamed protein product [marine sediment metagenome]|uniref:Uncharacterized protein n=1 Tax=marine sediment metagenome TaxID=412755 RepID=X1PZD6_9ZZZZ
MILFAEEVKYDFRKTNWGMSVEQVKATEDKKPGGESDTVLAYEVEIDAKDFICLYQFLENKLFFSGYNYKEEHINYNLYINDYEDLKEILIKKYGKPMKDEEMWDNLSEWELEAYKQNLGNSISAGFLTYFAFWETFTTRIELILDGDNYEINLRIRYISKELEEWANKIKEERAKSEF